MPQDGGTPPGAEFGCGKVQVVDIAVAATQQTDKSTVHYSYFAAPKFSPWGSASVLGHPPTTSVLRGGHEGLIGSACRRLPRPATAHPGLAACTPFFTRTVIAGLYAYQPTIYNPRTEILPTSYIAYCLQFICLMLFFIVVFRQTGIASRHLECSDVFSPPEASESFVSRGYSRMELPQSTATPTPDAAASHAHAHEWPPLSAAARPRPRSESAPGGTLGRSPRSWPVVWIDETDR